MTQKIQEPKIDSVLLDRLATQFKHFSAAQFEHKKSASEIDMRIRFVSSHPYSDDYGHENDAFLAMADEETYYLKTELPQEYTEALVKLGKECGVKISATGPKKAFLNIDWENLTAEKVRALTVKVNKKVLEMNGLRVGDQVQHSFDLLNAALQSLPEEDRVLVLSEFLDNLKGIEGISAVAKQAKRHVDSTGSRATGK